MRKVFIVVITVLCAIDLSNGDGQWVGRGLTQDTLGQIKTYEEEKLDLSGNEIESLDFNQFINFTNLHTLILNENKNFDFIPEQKFLNAQNLETLKCETCNISRIYNVTFEGLISLKTLDLSENKLTSIDDDAFATNRQLVRIDFSSNSLKVLNPELFTPTQVRHLNLDANNDLIFESRKYLATKGIVTLELRGAGFKEITAKMLSNLPALEQLYLSENEITTIEQDAFKVNKELAELLLNDNSLKIFDPKLIEDLSNLTVFCLDTNKFIPDSRNARLQVVYAKRNYRSRCSFLGDEKQRFEKLDLTPLLEPTKNNTEETKPTPKENTGISDAYIGSYLALIVIIQTVALVVLVWYLFILTKQPDDSKDQIDYSSTILNDSEIYAVDRRR